MCNDDGNQSTARLIYTRLIEKLKTREDFSEELISRIETNLKAGKLSSLNEVTAILTTEEGSAK